MYEVQMIPLGQIAESPLNPRKTFAADTIRRFWEKVTVTKAPTCWLWTGSIAPNGYGQLKVLGKSYQAHRFSWLVERGDIPEGLCALHRCDVRACVNPNHLFLGTYRDNAQDMASKGRAHLQRNPMALAGDCHWTKRHPELTLRGERNPAARLTEGQVLEIRESFAAGATYSGLANRFGVGVNTVFQIVTGTKWKHVGGPIGRRKERA